MFPGPSRRSIGKASSGKERDRTTSEGGGGDGCLFVDTRSDGTCLHRGNSHGRASRAMLPKPAIGVQGRQGAPWLRSREEGQCPARGKQGQSADQAIRRSSPPTSWHHPMSVRPIIHAFYSPVTMPTRHTENPDRLVQTKLMERNGSRNQTLAWISPQAPKYYKATKEKLSTGDT